MAEKSYSRESDFAEETTSCRKVFSGSLLQLHVHEILTPSGQTARREVVSHPGGVVIVPILNSAGDSEIVLVKQYRKPAEEALWELPAGTLEKGERPLECAKRELAEETGFGKGEWIEKGSLYTSPGYSDELLYSFIARNLHRLDQETLPEAPPEENIQWRSFPLEKVYKMAGQGEIRDGKTLSGLAYLLLEKTTPS
ncbi:MAG: NUDIX hydrolase [Candidatus Acetothermia bacterium]